MILRSNKILVRISEDLRMDQFVKKGVDKNGKPWMLFTGVQETDMAQDRAFEQAVLIGLVEAVAHDVEHVKVGDLAMLDYTVDMNNAYLVYQDGDKKKVVIDARHTFEEDDNLVPASRATRAACYAWKKGDIATVSPLLGVIRDEEVIPNDMMIVSEYHDDVKSFKSVSGIEYDHRKYPISTRKVLASYPGSEIKGGDHVLVESEFIAPFDFGGHRFNIFFESDVLMSF